MYMCIGAAIFMTLESENETTTSSEILPTVNTFLAEHSTCLSSIELQKFLHEVNTAYQNGVFTTNETRSATQWDYPSSMFFAMTVTTTIAANAEQKYRTLFKILVNLWIYIGLTWFTTIISSISDKYTESIKKREEKYTVGPDKIKGWREKISYTKREVNKTGKGKFHLERG
ncbi:KCNK5 [Mytilus coruscus]|uniref:KCNK5 n=1 Tax=Mytilus coruscus TaxID=42192 RepID=A0A6J8D6A2_MYTCO|nr:KCNK5 [Mytilus coruscus]